MSLTVWHCFQFDKDSPSCKGYLKKISEQLRLGVNSLLNSAEPPKENLSGKLVNVIKPLRRDNNISVLPADIMRTVMKRIMMQRDTDSQADGRGRYEGMVSGSGKIQVLWSTLFCYEFRSGPWTAVTSTTGWARRLMGVSMEERDNDGTYWQSSG